MKAVILAGGLGTRISEETHQKPKPMVEIGGKPILWHIMKIYSAFGIDEFIICLGYKGYVIKEFFANYYRYNSDVTFDLKNNETLYHQNRSESWRVTLVDTGPDALTATRIKRVSTYLNEDMFCLTYGDCVANIDIQALIDFHIQQGRLATLTAVQPPGRYGSLALENDQVHHFTEKPLGDGGWINGGFFVLSREVLNYIQGDVMFEQAPLNALVQDQQVSAFRHSAFWHPMDTLRDQRRLESEWQTGRAPWKIWSDHECEQ